MQSRACRPARHLVFACCRPHPEGQLLDECNLSQRWPGDPCFFSIHMGECNLSQCWRGGPRFFLAWVSAAFISGAVFFLYARVNVASLSAGMAALATIKWAHPPTPPFFEVEELFTRLYPVFSTTGENNPSDGLFLLTALRPCCSACQEISNTTRRMNYCSHRKLLEEF